MFGKMLARVAGCDYAFAGWWRYDLLGGLNSLEERCFDLGKTEKSGGECLVHLGERIAEVSLPLAWALRRIRSRIESSLPY